MPNKKPNIAIVSLTCCEGCQVAILDLGERLLELTEKIKIGDFAMIEEQAEPETYDVVFVEGTPITPQNVARVKDLRSRTKLLVTIGACACLGGIAELKNYQDKEQRLRYVYKNFESIANPDIRPVKYYVKVDLEIPGCPINKEEFLWAAKELIAGVIPKIPQRPVCYECQLRRNECLLQKGEPCLGPVILGGCGAPCPSAAYPCDGCRGPLKGAAINNFNNKLKEIYGFSQQEIDLIMQRFGMLDDMYPPPPAKPENKIIKK
jgi:sulfhydrogenase subunit delta